MEEPGVRVAGELIREVFLKNAVNPASFLVLDACVAALRKGRHSGVVLLRLRAHLRARLAFNPSALQSIETTIAIWQQDDALLDQSVVPSPA
jgi:hypothetical protein